jgi:hypothetical protein
MKHIKEYSQFVNEAKLPDSFKDEKAMQDFVRSQGGIKYGYGSGGGGISASGFDNQDEDYREPWFTFKAMLRHYARDDDFMNNEAGPYAKEYKKLVADWMDSEMKSLPKFMKKYLTVGSLRSSSDPAYLIKPELRSSLVYDVLKMGSKGLRTQYRDYMLDYAGHDTSDKLGL